MNVDRLSVTVPNDLGTALRKVAAERGESVSQLVCDAIAHQLRLIALDEALRAADAEFGPLSEDEIQAAMAVQVGAIDISAAA